MKIDINRLNKMTMKEFNRILDRTQRTRPHLTGMGNDHTGFGWEVYKTTNKIIRTQRKDWMGRSSDLKKKTHYFDI